MILYLDSVFAEPRERIAEPSVAVPDTLNKLYLQAMRDHARDALLMQREGERWCSTPDWRFDRHVIRLGLYLRHHMGIEPGDRVAIAANLRPEWLLADSAIMGMGGVSAAIPVSLPPEEMVAALADLQPRAAFVSQKAWNALQAGGGPGPSVEHLICFDPIAPSEQPDAYSAVLEVGGTLDTPERAHNYRHDARRAEADESAMIHYDVSGQWHELTHRQVMDQVKRRWLADPAAHGDRVYIAGSDVTLKLRLFLHAFLGDGVSTMILGTPGRALEELLVLSPDKVLGPTAFLEAAVRRRLANDAERSRGVRGRLRRALRIVPGQRARQESRSIREAFGGRIRSVGSLTSLSPSLAASLPTITPLEIASLEEECGAIGESGA